MKLQMPSFMAELKKSEACGKGHRWSAGSHMQPSLLTVESLVATLQAGWLVGGPGSRGGGVSGVLLQTVEQRRNMIAKVLWSHREPVRVIYCHQFVISSCPGARVCRFVLSPLPWKGGWRVTSP